MFAGGCLSAFAARHLANCIWAFAKLLLVPEDDLLKPLVAEMLAKASGFNAQNLANTLWAFATLSATLFLC